ncbi:MAG TPA: 5-deoxy-glucuronate isomerase [Clostridiaceae bacterium]|jgi:5-deoxy-glucuronate isomerase|nr:5-deoxy-glucuronate isomerase [Clostridiaceae bacterium]
MNFKRHWDGGYGCKPIYKKQESICRMIEIDMLRLAPGQSHKYDESDKEYALILLRGTCSISGEDLHYPNIGRRANVFDGPATALYIPRNRKFKVTGDTEVTVAVCKSPAAKDSLPVLVKPEDVVIKDLGKPGWQRQAHFIVDERISANLIYVGEAFVEGGQWASYPPHKHDENKMPTEGFLEEIYYFEYDKPTGFGIQKVYTKDGGIDETYTVKNGDFVELPKGYHPCCCAPGYKNYYLWVMAGENRGFFMTADPDHAWLNG